MYMYVYVSVCVCTYVDVCYTVISFKYIYMQVGILAGRMERNILARLVVLALGNSLSASSEAFERLQVRARAGRLSRLRQVGTITWMLPSGSGVCEKSALDLHSFESCIVGQGRPPRYFPTTTPAELLGPVVASTCHSGLLSSTCQDAPRTVLKVSGNHSCMGP